MNYDYPKVVGPYCGNQAILRDSAIVYGGRSYGLIWICLNYPTCDSYCGVHKGTNRPLGRLANAELRLWRNRAHEVFDQLWKSKRYSRKKAYAIASDIMGTPIRETHIALMDIQDCKDLIKSIHLLNDDILI